jgi:medium-chain acyl-[acyl-carrier-protein] hydrolase
VKVFARPGAAAGTKNTITQRLFCFPYAGGGTAVFRTWPDFLPPHIEVCVPELPGREAEIDKVPIADIDVLVDLLLEQMLSHLSIPYAVFGHSMGAFIAFELAHAIRRRGLREPTHLFASGQRAPKLPYPEKPIFTLPDAAFTAAVVARYDGIPKEILQDREFMQLMLPTLRADFTLGENYRYRGAGPLACPIIVLGGLQDGLKQWQLEAWAPETSARCSVHLFPGGHFFINTARTALFSLLCRELRD